jgi:hypothetical protein
VNVCLEVRKSRVGFSWKLSSSFIFAGGVDNALLSSSARNSIPN